MTAAHPAPQPVSDLPGALTFTTSDAWARRAADTIRERVGIEHADAVVVLGSGWEPAAAGLGVLRAEFDMSDIPGFLAPVAPGHAGLVRVVSLGDLTVLVLSGRTHLYEGHGPHVVAHPVRTAAALGCRLAVLTNANGSLRTDWPVGTIMAVEDHLNLSSTSPISGGTFVDLTDCWSARARRAALAVDSGLVTGVYAFLSGPHYETAAEARMLRLLGADVVGMSGALEAIAAHAAGLEVLGFSVVSAIEHDGEPLDPVAVVAAAETATARMGETIAATLTATLAPASPAPRRDAP